MYSSNETWNVFLISDLNSNGAAHCSDFQSETIAIIMTPKMLCIYKSWILLHLLIHNECNTNQPKHSHFVCYKLTVTSKSLGAKPQKWRLALILLRCHLPRQQELILQSVYDTDTFVWPTKSLRLKLGTLHNPMPARMNIKDNNKNNKNTENTKTIPKQITLQLQTIVTKYYCYYAQKPYES